MRDGDGRYMAPTVLLLWACARRVCILYMLGREVALAHQVCLPQMRNYQFALPSGNGQYMRAAKFCLVLPPPSHSWRKLVPRRV